jgi:hypothetical protein
MFPNTMAAWRLNAIEAFIESFDADILVFDRIWVSSGTVFKFEWTDLVQSHHLYKYDLLIFNPRLNYLNYVNELNRTKDDVIDGTKFNGMIPGDYLLRLKKYRNSAVNLNVYAAYYHIFIYSFDLFRFKLGPYWDQRNGIKHIVHCYPGGGFSVQGSYHPGNYEGVHFIATQAFVTESLQRELLPRVNITVVDIFGVPLLRKNQTFPVRAFDMEHNYLRVCLTFLGDATEKGLPHYIELSKYFKSHFPQDNVTFYLVTHPDAYKQNGVNSGLVYVPPMPQANLSLFYEKNVDVICNFETTRYKNGWPLGVEAVLTGALLLTTDSFNLNVRNRFNFNEGLIVANRNNLSDTASWLHLYVNNRRRLQRDSMIIQRRAFELFSYETQLLPILDLTKGIILSKPAAGRNN